MIFSIAQCQVPETQFSGEHINSFLMCLQISFDARILFSIVAASHKMITRNRQVDQYLMRRSARIVWEPASQPLCVCARSRVVCLCIFGCRRLRSGNFRARKHRTDLPGTLCNQIRAALRYTKHYYAEFSTACLN
jgi:hypothetical protein